MPSSSGDVKAPKSAIGCKDGACKQHDRKIRRLQFWNIYTLWNDILLRESPSSSHCPWKVIQPDGSLEKSGHGHDGGPPGRRTLQSLYRW